ncbi:hypothetical protein OIG24_11085, partial [Neisseria meningitidis]|nr:hypothetical protein [Neisseria meningitidis]
VACSSWQSFLQERPYATAYWPFSVRESCTSNANPPYLEIDPKTISESNVANYVLFPNPEQITKEFCSSKIDDDLMLDEEFIPIEIIGENELIPCGYLDFDIEYWSNYLFSEKNQ